MDKATIVLISLILYQGVLILVGYWASRRVHDEEDYLLGGRQLGPVVAGFRFADVEEGPSFLM